MKPGTSRRRRIVLRTLAGAVLVVVSRFSLGQAGKAEGEEKKAGRTAALTVLVMGNSKPVAQAEVKASFSGGGEATRVTGESGEAVFNSAGMGKGSVRIIATGWASVMQDITLKEGVQSLVVELSPLGGN